MSANAEELAERSAARMERKLAKEGGGYVPAMVQDARDGFEGNDEGDDNALDIDLSGSGDSTPNERQGGDSEAARLRAEMDQLRQELAAAQGRSAPVQRDLETYRTLTVELQRNLDQQRQQYEERLQSLQEQAAARDEEFDPAEVLSQEELDDFDPQVLKSMTKLADALARRRMPQINIEEEVRRLAEKQAQEELKVYREQVLISKDLSDIVHLKSDPKFLEWVEQDDNEIESTVAMLLNATTKGAIDKYARILKGKINRFKQQSPSQGSTASDANTRLATGMRRKQNNNFDSADVEARLMQARRLARSQSAADRQKAQDILNALGG